MFISFFSAGLALHADYMANMSVLGSRMGELHHSPSLLGSTELPFSLDGKKKHGLIIQKTSDPTRDNSIPVILFELFRSAAPN